ncbi:MAG: hypothetical protein QG670_2813 [Thermoproteota archaeon]|nr:hypothetical protein [Thermoproteota archaeon]
MSAKKDKNENENSGVSRKLFENLYNVNPEKVPWGYNTPDADIIPLIDKLDVPPNARVLDAGCGNGKNSVYLREKGFETYGFDISSKAIAFAHKSIPTGDFVVADAVSLPYAEEVFDLIVDVGLLHSIPPDAWESYKKETNRILKPKGYYFLRSFHRPLNYPPDKPILYENTDQTGRSYFERDPNKEQFPIWGFNIPQIRDFFKEFKIRVERYSNLGGGDRLYVVMSKEEKKGKGPWYKRVLKT